MIKFLNAHCSASTLTFALLILSERKESADVGVPEMLGPASSLPRISAQSLAEAARNFPLLRSSYSTQEIPRKKAVHYDEFWRYSTDVYSITLLNGCLFVVMVIKWFIFLIIVIIIRVPYCLREHLWKNEPVILTDLCEDFDARKVQVLTGVQ